MTVFYLLKWKRTRKEEKEVWTKKIQYRKPNPFAYIEDFIISWNNFQKDGDTFLVVNKSDTMIFTFTDRRVQYYKNGICFSNNPANSAHSTIYLKNLSYFAMIKIIITHQKFSKLTELLVQQQQSTLYDVFFPFSSNSQRHLIFPWWNL